MAKIQIRHNPDLTTDEVMRLFSDKFRSRYEIYPTKLIGSDFVVKKSGWTGIAVKLLQKKDKTLLRYGAFAPSVFVRLFFGGIILIFLYFTRWKKMQNEIKDFITSSAELGTA